MEFRTSSNFYELTIVLLLVSGRREQEVLNLNPHQTENPKAFMSDQQQKKKEVEYEVPLYDMEFGEFQTLINKMKPLKPNIHKDIMLNKLRNKLRMITGNDKIVIHNLRMVYASASSSPCLYSNH
jgi:hypothetical protein